MQTIYIFTGSVQSGKTTRLLQWIKRKQCAGILSPIIKNKRHIYSILSDKSRCLEVDDLNDDKIDKVTIGKYNFSNEVFGWARKQLAHALDAKKKWLVIDEIGPLELKGQGLEPVISQILNNYELSERNRLLLVVRENLISDVITYYQIENISRIDTNLP
jgi:nucleoside-triphosphatase THEP1